MPTRVKPGTIDELRDARTGALTCLVEKLAEGKQTPRDLYRIPGLGTEQQFTSCANNRVNAYTALLERVFFHEIGGVFQRPAIPGRGVVESAFRHFRSSIKCFARELAPVPVLEYPKTVYSGRRLALYQKAAEDVARRGPLISDSFLSTFLKHEKLPVSKKRVVPRVIQPRRPQYNVEVGRYLHQLEHVLYSVIADIYGAPTVMKGYNAFQQGRMFSEAWGEFNSPAGLGLDASRFDQHISTPLLSWEHGVYGLFYHNDGHLARLLRWQLKNRGYIRTYDGSFRYKVDGGRCSGDMNTAMGNCLIMCAAVHSLLHHLGMARRGASKVRLFNNGDDCMLIGERADLARVADEVPAYFARLGLVMKVEPLVDVFEKLSFCQTQPVRDELGVRMCRDPRVSLSKDATQLDLGHSQQPNLTNQLYAIGQCGLALCGGLPVLQAYYTAVQRGQHPGKGVDYKFYQSGFYQLSKGLVPKQSVVTDTARVSFYNAFGIPPDLQIELERYYDSMPPIVGGPVQDIDEIGLPL